MENYKIIILSIFFGIFYSLEVSIDQASNVAQNFYESRNLDNITIESIHTIGNEDRNLIYIFILDPKGFIIVSGNNAAMPILGYSFDNEYQDINSPIQFNYLINIINF